MADNVKNNPGRRRQRNSRLSSSSINSVLSTQAWAPLPITITVRNLFPPRVVSRDCNEEEETDNYERLNQRDNNNIIPVEDRCKLAAQDVLLRTRLDILIKESKSSPEILLYSSEKLNCTAHPRWDHLDEQLPLSDDDHLQDEDLANIYARFVAIREDCNSTTAVEQSEEILLAEISLNPSNLRRLPKNDDDQIIINSNNVKNLTVPDSLPPNAILLHYGDGYTRVVPELHSLLVQKGITTENIATDLQLENESKEDGNNDSFTNEKEENDDKDKSVFDDAAFDTLGNISEGVTVNEAEKNKTNSIDTDEDVPLPNDIVEKETVIEREDDETMYMDTSTLTESDTYDVSPVQVHLPPISDPLAAFPSNEEMETIRNGNIDREIEELKRLIDIETQLLEQEQSQVEEERKHSKFIMEQIEQLDQESTQVMKSIGIESMELYRAEFRLEAHRIRLLKQLQMILPIRVVSVNIAVNPPQYPQHQYTVASIPLPDDIHSASVSDEQISTSIGYLCHSVSLTSKYLAISPRYKMICRFSRSAIIDDQTGALSNNPSTVYPLFRERGAVDREQLDHGFALLVRNIECLLKTRQIEFNVAWNALAKMKKVFTHIVDGSN